jgi:hypothetical protein
MDARNLRPLLAFFCLAASSFGASHRTENFIVSAPTRSQARQIAEAAERYRRDLSIEWLERELPRWPQPCPIRADVNPSKGAGGATSFAFQNRQPFGWEMTIQGSFERIMDSVLPHEVTHTIFATHFGGPLPRWADEGACTTVEHVSERKKQEDWLIQFIREQRGIPFNQMFAMTEYPQDILPLYAQGYSVARYLIAQGGKPKFIAFVGDGLASNDWNAAIGDHYNFDRLGDLQLAWQDWIREGQQIGEVRRDGNIVLASASSSELSSEFSSETTKSAQAPEPLGVRPIIQRDDVKQVASVTTRNASTNSDGWYARQVQTANASQPGRLATTRVDRDSGPMESNTVTPPSRPRPDRRSTSGDDSGWTSLSVRPIRDSTLRR